jgi:miniconductance mechanosensitive channel
LGSVVIVAVLIGKSPALLLSGIGALTAVLMLIFKDTILSLVASLQISSNDLFKIGDWIEVPQFGADGDVVDIALHAVKIQNWDKTISIIPTHKLIDSAFRNWRGMSESGGRRIKRSLYIDMNSIHLCTEEMLDKFMRFEILTEYINGKIKEVTDHNESNKINTAELINGRRLTNVGTFRAYIEAYLQNNSKIHPEMTFLIRQLEPTSRGLPIQIYVFTNDTDWVRYEGIQADIFDHLLAIIPEFGLKVFQSPSGKDFSKLRSK